MVFCVKGTFKAEVNYCCDASRAFLPTLGCFHFIT